MKHGNDDSNVENTAVPEEGVPQEASPSTEKRSLSRRNLVKGALRVDRDRLGDLEVSFSPACAGKRGRPGHRIRSER